MLRREGEYWTILFEGTVIRLRDTKGLRYLEALLRHPGRSVHVTTLVALFPDSGEVPRAAVGKKTGPDQGRASPQARPSVARRDAERARLNVTKAIKAALDRIAAAHPGLGDHLRATVRRGYSCVYMPDLRYPCRWEE